MSDGQLLQGPHPSRVAYWAEKDMTTAKSRSIWLRRLKLLCQTVSWTVAMWSFVKKCGIRTAVPSTSTTPSWLLRTA